MGVVWTITAKDLRQRLRDRSVLLLAFVVPIGLTIIFDLLFGGLASGSLGRVDLAVVDLDDGPAGAAFTERFLPEAVGSLEAGGTQVEIASLDSAAAARDGVDDGTHDAAIVLPGSMSSAFESGDAFDLEVITHADRDLVGDVATSLADMFQQRVRGQLGVQVLAERLQLSPDQAAEFSEAVGTVQGRVALDSSTAAGRQLDASTYLAAGMAVFFLFFTVQFGVLGYLSEREDGTLPRLLAGPISKWQVLAAKALVSLVVGVASVAVLMLVAIPVLGATWGDPVAVGALVLAAVLSATGIVAAVAAVARTAEQANVWQSIIAIVLGMVGGSFFPIQGGPDWLANLSLISPHAWFLQGLATLSDAAAGLGDVWGPIGAMLAFAVVIGAVGMVVARRGAAT